MKVFQAALLKCYWILTSIALLFISHIGIAGTKTTVSTQPENKACNSRLTDKGDIISCMSYLLWLAEHDEKQQLLATAKGELLYRLHPNIAALQPLKARLTRNLSWLLFINVYNSAGVRYITESKWHPDAPMLRVRKALLKPFDKGEYLLSGENRLVYFFQNKQTTTVKITLKIADVEGMIPSRSRIQYQLDKNPPVALTFPATTRKRHFSLHIPAGRHRLRFKMVKPVVNQYLRVHVSERGEPVAAKQEQSYFIATHKEPVIFKVAGPVLLRIDERRDDLVLSHYRLVESKQEILSLKPPKNRKESLLRIYKRIPVIEDMPLLREVPVYYTPVPKAVTQLKDRARTDQVTLIDGLPLGGQEDGTWSVSESQNRRKDVLEQEVSEVDVEDFQALNLNYRHYNEHWRTYFNTGIEQHIRRHGGATIGLQERINYRPIWSPFNFWLYGQVFLQNPNGNTFIPFDGKQQYSATLVSAISQQRQINPKTYHTPNVSFLTRTMSMEDAENFNPQDIDQSVFTSYTSNHRQIAEISDTFYYRPWLDSLTFLGGALNYNPSFTLLSSKFNLGWQQLLGPVQANASFHYARYYPEHLLRRAIALELIWQKWRTSSNLYELKFNLRREIDVQSTIGFLVFTFYNSNGRGYRDFPPNEYSFQDIRMRNVPGWPNNWIQKERQ